MAGILSVHHGRFLIWLGVRDEGWISLGPVGIDGLGLCGLCRVSYAQADVILAGPTPSMSTNQSFSLNFNSSAASTGLSFVLDGYASLDGQNYFEDDFSLKLNGTQIFLGTFNLGGGSNSGSQANIYSNPFAAALSNPTNNGTAITFGGGRRPSISPVFP